MARSGSGKCRHPLEYRSCLVALEEVEKAAPIYEELYPDLKENPEYLESYSYLLRELGQIAKAREVAEGYLQLVPDDGQMQAFYESLLED